MNIFILTGSGISADSGIKTFRDSETGIWGDEKLEEVCTAGAFGKNPELVNEFYNKRRAEVDAAKPNAAHYALAEYINKTKNNVMLVTQNIDNYHEIALGDPSKVIKMHGDIHTMFCVNCNHSIKVDIGYQHDINTKCVNCGMTKTIRQDVVFFGEDIKLDFKSVKRFLKSKVDSESLSYFFSIGTSGVVEPAASFGKYAHYNSHKVYINLTDEDTSHIYDEEVVGRAVDTVPEVFENMYKRHG